MKGISNRGGCKCKQHEFILKPLVKDVHFSRKVTVSLCQCDKIREKKKMIKIRKQCTSAYPVFNQDGNYATPAFILDSQKQHFEQNRQIYLKDHGRKVKQYEQTSQNLYLPAPRSNYDYCNVCCCSYDDYIEHITSDGHHRQIKRAKFNNYILEIEQKFSPQTENNGSMKRTATSRCIEIDQDSSSGMFGYKKVKADSRTELPSQNNLKFMIGDNFIKEYQTYCQLNNLLILQQQQQNIMEKSIENCQFQKYNFNFQFQMKNAHLHQYNVYQQLLCAQQLMMRYQNSLTFASAYNQNYWQNFNYNMIAQNNFYLSQQLQQMQLQLRNQYFQYYPHYFQSISALQ